MKKCIAIAILIIGLGVISSDSFGQFSGGVKAGYNMATLGGMDQKSGVTATNSLSGFHAGLFGQIKILMLTIQVDGVYSAQGGKFTDARGDHKYENNYVNFPAVLKVNLGPVFVLGGLQYGILASSKIDGVKDDAGFFFKKTDISAPIGLGFNLSKIIIEARYNIGLTNVNNITGDQELLNEVVQISAGLKLGKRK